jgi:hypothetical protein
MHANPIHELITKGLSIYSISTSHIHASTLHTKWNPLHIKCSLPTNFTKQKKSTFNKIPKLPHRSSSPITPSSNKPYDKLTIQSNQASQNFWALTQNKQTNQITIRNMHNRKHRTCPGVIGSEATIFGPSNRLETTKSK